MKTFLKNYNFWLDDCLEQWNETRRGMIIGPRQYHQDNVPDDCEPGELVEFSEDGDAYPHGIGGVGYVKRAVTPWADSEHYTHWSA